MNKRYALCVGINDYPGAASDLSGCVNDAQDWTSTLGVLGYDVVTLLDAEASKANIVDRILERLSLLKAGDRFVFTFSGHGTWIPDQNGDEIDKRDEALCCFDYAKGGLLIDDEMFDILKRRKFGSRVTILSDSCHSGSVSRLMLNPDTKRTARFVSPSEFMGISEKEVARAEAFVESGKPRSDAVLISGCADHEYSYDANFDGRPNGAFTYFARKAIAEAPAARVKDVYARIRMLLPSPEYPQTPQLTAGTFQQRSTLL